MDDVSALLDATDRERRIRHDLDVALQAHDLDRRNIMGPLDPRYIEWGIEEPARNGYALFAAICRDQAKLKWREVTRRDNGVLRSALKLCKARRSA